MSVVLENTVEPRPQGLYWIEQMMENLGSSETQCHQEPSVPSGCVGSPAETMRLSVSNTSHGLGVAQRVATGEPYSLAQVKEG